MSLVSIDPCKLNYSHWNVNSVSPANQAKLEKSLEKLGQFRPVICRETDAGLEVIAGEHTSKAMIARGAKSIDVYNLGRISDEKAKAISIADNRQWGSEDGLALAHLLKELEDQDLVEFMPYTEEDLTEIFSATEIDLDGLGFDEESDSDEKDLDDILKETVTHEVMRFRVPIQEREFITQVIEAVIRRKGLSDPDAMINAGDALVQICRSQGESK